MTVPWWITKPEFYKQAIKDISEYRGLRYCIEHNQFIVSGSWPVYGGQGEKQWIEDFLIKIVFPDKYPDNLPKVYETGNKIKIKNANTHFNKDGSACLFYPTERYLLFSINELFELKKFLDGPVKSFFFSQLYYIHHKKWPFGQRSHDTKGLLEFYAESLKIPCDPKSVLQTLTYLLKLDIKGHWPCPCGNEKIRKCHVKNFRFLKRRIPKKVIQSDLDELFKQYPQLNFYGRSTLKIPKKIFLNTTNRLYPFNIY